MNKSIGLQLIAYSLLLAGLGTFAHRLAPALGQTMLFTGLAGGGLCLVWGVGALLGEQRKAPAILTNCYRVALFHGVHSASGMTGHDSDTDN